MTVLSAVVCVRSQKALNKNKKHNCCFVYDRGKGFAQELVNHMDKDGSNIDGMFIATRMVNVAETLPINEMLVMTFIVERPDGAQWVKVRAYNALLIKVQARNSFSILHLSFSPYLPVLQSQKLERERLFLHFCSARANECAFNLSAKRRNYYMCIPKTCKCHE